MRLGESDIAGDIGGDISVDITGDIISDISGNNAGGFPTDSAVTMAARIAAGCYPGPGRLAAAGR